MDHVYRGVEMVIHKWLACGARRILADYERDGTVCVHVINAILGVILENENRGVIPVRAVRDLLDDPTHREVVVGDTGSRAGLSRRCTVGVIVGQIEESERR